MHIHIHRRVLWNSCIKMIFFASTLSVISVPHQPPLNAPWFGICSNLTPLSSKGHMPCLSFGAAWDCLPVSSFLGSSVGIALFDLCYLDYNGAAEEDPLALISSTRRQHTPVSPRAGLMPSEKYNLFHSGSIPAISTPIVQCLKSNWSFEISAAAARKPSGGFSGGQFRSR